jgi:hypothetical protein
LRIEKQLVSLKSLLESGRHEGISRSRVDEDLEVDPEEEEVKEEWDNDESNDSVSEMPIKVGLSSVGSFDARRVTHHSMSFLYIQNLPKIPQDSSSDTHESE